MPTMPPVGHPGSAKSARQGQKVQNLKYRWKISVSIAEAMFSEHSKGPNFFDSANWRIMAAEGDRDNPRLLLDAEKVPSDQVGWGRRKEHGDQDHEGGVVESIRGGSTK